MSSKIIKIFSFLLPLFLFKSALSQDPLPAKIDVSGETEISIGKGLVLKPVPQTSSPPADAQLGDLYFDGSSLYTCTQPTCTVAGDWDVVSEEGDLFYNDADNSLYFYNGTEWQKLGGGEGPKAVGTRIIAACDSLDSTRDGINPCLCDGSACSNPRADYTCDGVNDQQEINQAIQEIANAGLGGSVYLLAGTYNISDVLLDGQITPGINLKSNISLIGEGGGTVLKTVSSSDYNIINAHGTSTNHLSGILISQLRIDGNKDNVTGSNFGISFEYVDDSKMTKLWVENLTSSGMRLENSSYNIISKSFFIKNDSDGVYLSSSDDNIISKSNFSENGDVGIELDTSDSNIIDSNIVYKNDNKGIRLTSSDNNIILGNNISYTQTFHGLQLYNSSQFNIVYGNNINNNKQGFLINQSSTHNLISSNFIHLPSSGSGYAMSLSQSGNNLLVGNNIYDEETNNASLSIANSSEVLIASNLINYPGSPEYGIEITSGSSDNYLAGNQVIDSSVDGPGKIEDEGTNIKYTQKEKMTIERWERNLGSSSSYNLPVSTYPHSYVVFISSFPGITNLMLEDGKSAGDLLILENESNVRQVKVDEAANVNLGDSSRTLGQYETLELIWNGTKWIEVKYVDRP